MGQEQETYYPQHSARMNTSISALVLLTPVSRGSSRVA